MSAMFTTRGGMLLGAIGISEAREAAERDRDGGTSKRVSPVVRSGGVATTTGSKVASRIFRS